MNIKLKRYASGAEFKGEVWSFLQQHEAENNLPIGISGAVAQNPTTYGDDMPYLAAVFDGDEIVAAAVRTPPRSVILSHNAPEPALELLATDLCEEYGNGLTGVVASVPAEKRFAAIYERLTGCKSNVEMGMRIYRLDEVTFPQGVSGTYRRASRDEFDLLVSWHMAFIDEATHESTDRTSGEKGVERWLSSPDHELGVWVDGGEVVSMAGAAGPTPNGIRIGAVYTPPEKRRRGYASAVVAQLSQNQLDSGRKFCFLFTDLQNPTSNSIYMKMGYVPVCDANNYDFVYE